VHVVALAPLQLVGDRLLQHLYHVAALGAPDEPLGRVHRVAGIELPLPLGLVPDQLVSLFVDGEDGRDDEFAALVGHQLDRSALDDRRAAVGGSEIDPDDLAHGVTLSWWTHSAI